jgi:integrase
MESIGTLISQAMENLDAQGYCDRNKCFYRGIWRGFERFCIDEGHNYPQRSIVDEYLKNTGVSTDGHDYKGRRKRNALWRLFDLNETGSYPLAYQKRNYHVPQCFIETLNGFEEYLDSKNLSPRTVKSKNTNAVKFLSHVYNIGITSAENIKSAHVYSYLDSLRCSTSVARSALLYFLRQFLGYLASTQQHDPSIVGMFPVILVNRNESLPSIYNSQELAKILRHVSGRGACARRNRAVALLAMQLGLRAGDIQHMRWEHIDWQNCRLSFIQQKTKKLIDLPLPEECFFAILDYLKNERPDSVDQHIFLRGRAPYTRLNCSSTFNLAINFIDAGITVDGKHHGMHALRHSAAANMLLSNTPYPVISGILGHSNANTTKLYLRIDVERMRPLSLEVPHGE